MLFTIDPQDGNLNKISDWDAWVWKVNAHLLPRRFRRKWDGMLSRSRVVQ